jgi:4-hydroxy-tetrahydrodipicolinate synthase
LGWAARTGRFLYHKDTVADLDPILAKIAETLGTSLAFCNAHTPTALRSLAAGATGLSPIGANYYPQLYARLCAMWRTQPEAARDLQRMLSVMEGVAVNKYLTAAKRGLGKRGLPIGTRCRAGSRQWTYDDEALLDALLETVARLDAGEVF